MHAGIHSPPPDQRQAPPGTRHPPGPGTPPSAVHAGRYGQQAGGTHPTGMQSCLLKWCSRSIWEVSVRGFKMEVFIIWAWSNIERIVPVLSLSIFKGNCLYILKATVFYQPNTASFNYDRFCHINVLEFLVWLVLPFRKQTPGPECWDMGNLPPPILLGCKRGVPLLDEIWLWTCM